MYFFIKVKLFDQAEYLAKRPNTEYSAKGPNICYIPNSNIQLKKAKN